MNSFNEIESLWGEWQKLPFPLDVAGAEVAGICVTSLDTSTAGCIDAFIERKGSLDKRRFDILETSQKELQIIVNYLNSESKIYFDKLLILTNKVIQSAKDC